MTAFNIPSPRHIQFKLIPPYINPLQEYPECDLLRKSLAPGAARRLPKELQSLDLGSSSRVFHRNVEYGSFAGLSTNLTVYFARL